MTKVECFDRLFNKYYAGLLAFVDSYLHNKEESADIVQAAFVKLWERGELSRDEHSLKSFLYTASKNLTLDFLKHQEIADILGISVKTVEKRLKISINFIKKRICIIIL